MKNIHNPVLTYKVELSHLPELSKDTSQIKEPEVSEPIEEGNSKPPAIAVLPFTNMSGDPEQEYFADGITEDIITNLSLENIPCHLQKLQFCIQRKNYES